MMKKIFLFSLLIVFGSSVFLKCTQNPDDLIFIVFWNLENLFDTFDDPEKNDEDFLPTGAYEWTEERLQRKMYNLARTIRSMNDNQAPDIIGVCEIEHQYLLDSMVKNFLSDFNYKSVAIESPDNRGIDNGILFRADKFKLLSATGDTVRLSAGFNTRLILYVTLLTSLNDTLHVYVNHFPSRRGGEKESELNRIEAAGTLRNSVDKVLRQNPYAKIIIMGDFNDEPLNRSILNTLNAIPFFCDSLSSIDLIEDKYSSLFNISYESYQAGKGSFKYQNNWNMLDQIFISRELLIGKKLLYECGSFEVYKPYFIETQSGSFKGAPFPTYGGRRYLGGYSDHFPVTAKIRYIR